MPAFLRANACAPARQVNGYARRRDAARYVNAFHLLAASLECDVWFDYVPSDANIADLRLR